MATITAPERPLASADPNPTEAELIARARALVPVLRERAAACEQNRSVLPETVEDLRKAGFYRILQPKAYGGYEMPPMVHYRVAMELARGCPSTAWCFSIVGVHNWELALLDPQAAEDVWGEDSETRISSSYAPFGKVERVDGGFMVSGRWPWSSGCDHCSWAFLGGIAPPETESGPPEHRAFLIPRTDYEIEDNWHVLGLKGTGSKIVHVPGAFVPEHHTHRMTESFFGRNPGAVAFPSPNYRYPFGNIFIHTIAVVAVGMGDGALDAFIEHMGTRRGVYDGAKASEDNFVRHRIARAQSMIGSAHRMIEGNFAQMDAHIAAGEEIPTELRVRAKWDAALAGRTTMQAIDLLFEAMGGRGLMLDNPMQRFFRDSHAAANHVALNTDQPGINPGVVALGGESADFFC